MDFVIIGGDAAGMSAASRAKRHNPELNVTVLEKTSDVSYSACGMPYNIADPGRQMDDLVVRQAQVFREKQNIDLLTGHEAKKIDPTQKIVTAETTEGKTVEIHYDKLLIATGARPIIPGLPGFDLPGVMGLKSLEDGRKIKETLLKNNVRHVGILGMGYIALEMCEALRTLDIQVDMIKPRQNFLPWMDDVLSKVVQEEVESNGVGVRMGHDVEKIEKVQDRLKIRCPDFSLECDMVLTAIGVIPNSEIARNAGVDIGVEGAIAVDERLVTSNDHIYAAGDCADAIHVVTGKKVWIPLALRANRAGWTVADNVCGGDARLPGIVGTAVFKVFDLEVARTGLTLKEAEEAGFEPVGETIKTRSRAHAHPGATPLYVHMIADKKSGRLLGAQMVGKEGAAHRINAAAVALHAGMTIEQFFQCDMAYAPPFGPVWDPLLTAANQLQKKI